MTLKPHNRYADIAAYFDVNIETVERWLRAGRFGQVFKIGGVVRVPRENVEAFERAHVFGGSPDPTDPDESPRLRPRDRPKPARGARDVPGRDGPSPTARAKELLARRQAAIDRSDAT